jgi:hypothetical protein
MGDSGRGSVEALPRRCPISAEKGDLAGKQGWLPACPPPPEQQQHDRRAVSSTREASVCPTASGHSL